MKINYFLLITVILLLSNSCEQPIDPVVQSVNTTKDLLKKYQWHVDDLRIVLRDEDIPAPVLWSVTESLIEAGVYDLDDLLFDASEVRKRRLQFTDNGKIVPIEPGGKGIFRETDDEEIASYFVFNDRTIRISNEYINLNYRYLYRKDNNEMLLTVSDSEAGKLISDMNEKLIEQIANKTPDKVGDLIASLLYNNKTIQKLINDALVNLISGKLSVINEINPEEAAEKLAEEIIAALGSVDWETKLTDLLKTELEKITGIDAEETAAKISQAVAEAIQQKLSIPKLYDFVLPYIEALVENPEGTSEQIAQLIVGLITDLFSEDNLQKLIAKAWEDFTLLDEEKLTQVADTLTGIVEELWINEEGLSSLILPFTQKIDDTSLFQLGNLAQQTTDSIQVLVEKINTQFPDLGLNPDYDNLNSAIKAIFIAAKPAIGLAGGPEEAAIDVANLVLNNFITSDFISNTFVSVISYLQSIDPDVVGEKLAAWLVNIEEQLAPEIIIYLKELLGPLLEDINPAFTAFKIAQALNGFIEENLGSDNIYNMVYPILKAFTDINSEAVANFLAKQILDLDIIKDNINQENIAAVLLPVLQDIKDTNVEDLVQNLINAVVDSGIFEDVITEEAVSSIIALLIYNSSWENVKIANNFKEATILLRHD